MRQELAGENPTALEKLLVERILACWLGVEHADAMLAQTTNAPPAHYDALQPSMPTAFEPSMRWASRVGRHRIS